MSHPKKPRLSWILVLVLDLASEYARLVSLSGTATGFWVQRSKIEDEDEFEDNYDKRERSPYL